MIRFVNRQFPRPCSGGQPEKVEKHQNGKAVETYFADTIEDLINPDRVNEIGKERYPANSKNGGGDF
jgi:hypothetical protein